MMNMGILYIPSTGVDKTKEQTSGSSSERVESGDSTEMYLKNDIDVELDEDTGDGGAGEYEENTDVEYSDFISEP